MCYTAGDVIVLITLVDHIMSVYMAADNVECYTASDVIVLICMQKLGSVQHLM